MKENEVQFPPGAISRHLFVSQEFVHGLGQRNGGKEGTDSDDAENA